MSICRLGIIVVIQNKKMSSIYRSQWEEEAREELKYLYEKKGRYGWTKSDAERAKMLEKELNKS